MNDPVDAAIRRVNDRVKTLELWVARIRGTHEIDGIPVAGTPNDGDALVYDDYTGTWQPSPATGGLDSVTDGVVTVTDATSLSFLRTSVTDGGAGVAQVDIDPLVTIAASGAAQTLDVADGGTFDVTFDADCTISLTGPTLTDNASMSVICRDGDAHTITWPGTVDWLGGSAPTLAALSVVVLWTVDGGTSWGGTLVGGGSGGTASDTVESETTWGIAADAGVSTEYSRGDHTHGTPAEPAAGTGGHILITDSPAGSPLVFADLLQNDTGTDLLYADA